jgi:2-keto-4-pentenoate hydratase/2-oxohepta-3-ene-1,7-dioic acid hydratase in catechol pathway
MKIIKFMQGEIKYFGIMNGENEIAKLKYDNVWDIIENIDKIKSNQMFSEFIIDKNLISILAPIEHPKRNIFCIGKNYIEHAKELTGKPIKEIDGIPNDPIYFAKVAYPAIGDNGKILLHSDVTDEVDYEVELGVIISKVCKNVSKENAKEYIFGYTIINDITARDLQGKHFQWLRGKSLDTFCPMGPVIVTADEISNHSNLKISLSVNGEIRQDSNTSKMIFNIEYLISELSKGMTLMPGDIIATGTPKGVGMGFTPPKYLKEGDEVICKIENIGELKNILVK